MQSVCSLLPDQYFRKVVDLRAALCEDLAVGAIYDPPFVHFTLQLAAEYDWPELAAGLAQFAKRNQPFEIRTIGLLAFTGTSTGIAIAPCKDPQLADFHAGVWGIASRCAQGRVDEFYHPDNWVPHVTIKRCGPTEQSFGKAMASLAKEDFKWTMTVDNVSVQHDPGQNSLTHYQRLRFPLGGSSGPPVDGPPPSETNAMMREVLEETAPDGTTAWVAKVTRDAGGELEARWSGPEVVRIMAAAKSSMVHFRDARCRVEEERVVSVVPNTPFSIAG